MSYLIAVLPNRTQAEAASSALVKNGLSTTQISILGEGYQSADEFGLVEPNQQATQQIIRLAYWLIPFGFVAGYVFNVLTGIAIFPGASRLLNHNYCGNSRRYFWSAGRSFSWWRRRYRHWWG